MLLFAVLAFCFTLSVTDAMGVTYTRWGRNTCPSGAYAVYKGFMAGSWYNHPGGASKFICMHNSPDNFNGTVAGFQDHSSFVMGVEYQIYPMYNADGKPLNWANNGGQSLHDNDAPCVVCYVPNKSVQIVIPGKVDCSSTDFDMEYSGVLMSAYYGHPAQSEFACIDRTPEAVPGGQANLDGALLYPAQVNCGSLACPPYTHGSEVPCAVCTV